MKAHFNNVAKAFVQDWKTAIPRCYKAVREDVVRELELSDKFKNVTGTALAGLTTSMMGLLGLGYGGVFGVVAGSLLTAGLLTTPASVAGAVAGVPVGAALGMKLYGSIRNVGYRLLKDDYRIDTVSFPEVKKVREQAKLNP